MQLKHSLRLLLKFGNITWICLSNVANIHHVLTLSWHGSLQYRCTGLSVSIDHRPHLGWLVKRSAYCIEPGVALGRPVPHRVFFGFFRAWLHFTPCGTILHVTRWVYRYMSVINQIESIATSQEQLLPKICFVLCSIIHQICCYVV